MVLVQKELKNAYIWIPNPTSIVLDKSFISLTTVWQTEQLTATIEPTISDHSITWSSDNTTVATVSTTGLVTCVTPWTCTITATTVNGLTASCNVSQSRLPSAYQEVEYIESSWTQYIDTWWTPSSNYCKIEANITPYTWWQAWSVFWGMTYSSNAYSLHTNQSNWYMNLGSSVNIQSTTFSSWTNLDLEFTADSWNYSLDLNGNTVTGTYSWTIVQSTRPFYLFAFNENWSTTWKANLRVYSFKIYSGASTLVRDLVPCYRKLDDEIWLYDVVNDVFYTNSWSGTFTKWWDV
jgi:hypothetical protein